MTADLFLVNAADISGRHTLELTLEDPAGGTVFTDSRRVNIEGGEEFGQLLAEGIELPSMQQHGRHHLRAVLNDRRGAAVADGCDDIFAVDCGQGPGIGGSVAVVETDGTVAGFIRETRDKACEDFDPDGPHVDYIIIGTHDYDDVKNLGITPDMRPYDGVLERVANGSTLIVLANAADWAGRMTMYEYAGVEYFGTVSLGNQGRFFAGHGPVMTGLPQDCALNWEFQDLYLGAVAGLRLGRRGVRTIVGLASLRSDEITDALAVVRYGEGMVVLTTLPFLDALKSDVPQSATVKRMFLNMLEYGIE